MVVLEIFKNKNSFNGNENYRRGFSPKKPIEDWIPSGSVNPIHDLLENYQAKASFSTREKARLECNKNWSAAKMLFAKQASLSAVTLAQKVFKFAKKYEFTELSLEICNKLSLFYGTISGEQKQYEYFSRLSQHYEHSWHSEMKVESCYTKFKSKASQKNILQANFIRESNRCAQELVELMRNNPSHDLYRFGSLYRIDLLLLKGHASEAIHVCDEAIQFFKTKNYETKSVIKNLIDRKKRIVNSLV